VSGGDALMAVFRDEASDGLTRLARLLLELEGVTDEKTLSERVRELFRLAHSLKGAASTVGRNDLTEVAHELESCLDKLRRGQLAPGRQLIDAALTAVDVLTAGLSEQVSEADAARVRAALGSASAEPARKASRKGRKDSRGEAPAAPAPPPSAPAAPQTPGEVAFALLPALAGLARSPGQVGPVLALLSALEAHPAAGAHPQALAVAASMRAVLQAERGSPDLERRRLESLVEAADLLQTELDGGATRAEAELVVRALEEVQATAAAPRPVAPVAPAAETLRVPVALLDAMLYRVEELVATKLRLDHQRRTVEHLQDLVAQVTAEQGPRGVEVRQRLELVRRDLAQEVVGLGLLAQVLQDDVRDVRMVQVGPLLEPFRRTVRDVAEACGKRARLELVGEEVRVDKRSFDLAKEPLTHLVRNAVDHGLEAPAARAKAGKPELGTVRIVASAQEGQVFLEVSDDGRGIDLDAVKAGARARGLLEAGRELTEQEALELIFQPGFTTAQAATTVSGRGVGLDVVRTNVARLGGRVDVFTRPGEGARFVLALPLTLASSGGLFVRVGRVLYCLPLSAVEEVRVLEPGEVGVSQSRLFARVRGQALPWAAMGDVLAQRGTADPPAKPTPAVVLALGERRAALAVDELIGQEEAVVKALAPGTPRLPLVAGATSLADGTLVTVLEPTALLASLAGMAAAAEHPSARERRARVLVVDDTLTTRTMLASVLERAGYEVLVAPDGEAAWARLLQERVELVVSDVDMPLLDGLGLTRRLRASPEHAALPVVLLTSLATSADRAKGAEAGATAYVVKTDFDPAAFLQLVAELTGAPR